jgi:hypothetical protein
MGLVAITTVLMELAAAGLLRGKDNLVAEPLQNGDRRARRLRKQRVAEAGDEESNAHGSP